MIEDQKVEMLSLQESTMYLGRHLNLKDGQAVEFEYRMGVAWKKFMARKKELCNKNIPLRDGLRLFKATVSKSALYGSEMWTM